MKGKNSRLLSLLGMFVALPMALGACTGDATEQPENGAESGAEGGGATDETLTLGINQEPTDFSPSRIQTILFPFTRQIYDSLIRYTDDLEPVPMLATEWEINESQDSVTITLRDDVTFHDGRSMTAEDVAANLEYFADPETGQQLFGPMAVVQDWEVVDDTTLTVNFTQPIAELQITDLLQSWTIGDPNFFDQGGDAAAGTGPYTFVEWLPGQRIVLERYDDYWGETPAFATLEYQVFDDMNSLVSGFEGGAVDVAVDVPALDAGRLESSNTVLEGYPGALIDQLRINPTTPPFDNAKVRQAINYAIDRETITEALYHGFSEPATLPYSQNSPAYDQELAGSLTYDLDRARQLLEESGLSPDELAATISVNSASATAPQAAQILQATLQEIGFDLEIQLQDSAAFTENVLGGNFQIIFSAIGNAQKYPTRITTNSIYRLQDNPVQAPEVFPEYPEAVAAANAAVAEEDQEEAFARLNEVLVETMWAPTVGYLPTLWLISPDVTGVERNVDNMLLLHSAAPAG